MYNRTKRMMAKFEKTAGGLPAGFHGLTRDYIDQFEQYLTVTIDHNDVDAALTNFPIVLQIDGSAGIGADDLTAVFDELSSDANRKKIALTTSSGQQCYVEIENWDNGNETATLHVRVPSISSSADTVLRFYYDKDVHDNVRYVGDTGDEPAQKVWSENFGLVYHMAEATGATVIDSTANGNDGTPIHAPVSATGQVGKCLDFDATNDYVNLEETIDPTADVDEFTIECWVKRDGGGWQSIFNKRYTAGGTGQIACYTGGNSDGEIKVMVGNTYGESTGTPFADTDWHHITIRNYDDSGTLKWRMYVDGAPDATVAIASGSVNSDADFLLGARRDTDNTDFASVLNGKFDEFRYSSVARSAAWIAASYESQRDHLVTYS